MTQPIATIRIELQGWRPKIWRKVDVALATDLGTLHEIIQAAMGWQNYHMYMFVAGGESYGRHFPEAKSYLTMHPSQKTTLHDLLNRGVKRFVYEYDFGDGWRHDIIVGKSRDGSADTNYPLFVAGEGRCPPEDVGGVWGFKNFLEIMMDPDHPEHGEMREWYGDDFDPAAMDELQVRVRLGAIAVHKSNRQSSRSGSRKKTTE